MNELNTAGKNGTPVTLQYKLVVTGVPNIDGTNKNFLQCTKEGTISGADLLSGQYITFNTTDFDTNEDGTVDYSIANEFVFGTVQAPEELELHTVEEYRAYNNSLTGAKITIQVTDITEYEQYTQHQPQA